MDSVLEIFLSSVERRTLERKRREIWENECDDCDSHFSATGTGKTALSFGVVHVSGATVDEPSKEKVNELEDQVAQIQQKLCNTATTEQTQHLQKKLKETIEDVKQLKANETKSGDSMNQLSLNSPEEKSHESDPAFQRKRIERLEQQLFQYMQVTQERLDLAPKNEFVSFDIERRRHILETCEIPLQNAVHRIREILDEGLGRHGHKFARHPKFLGKNVRGRISIEECLLEGFKGSTAPKSISGDAVLHFFRCGEI